jgi:hypothetical protein
MLGCLLHAPRGPFYSPKAARSRWRQTRKAILAFCRVVHRTVRCNTGQLLFMSGARFLSIWRTADRWSLGSVGAPDTVRCTPDSMVFPTDHWRDHVSREDGAADRCAGNRWLTGQSGAPPDSPVHHRTVRWIIVVCRRRVPRAASSPRTSLAHRTLFGAPPDTIRCTTGHYPVHHRTVRCAKPSWSLLHIANSFPIIFLLFLALRQNTLVLKTMY